MIKVQKTVNGKVLDFWQYTEEEKAKLRKEAEERKSLNNK